MSKKTVSVLLLIFLTLAVALFSVTSCKNEPELTPTVAPDPGKIPSVPNSLTTINRLSEEQTEAFSTVFGDVGRFFVDYLDTYGYDDNDGPLYDLMNDPQFSFGDATATLSAAASAGTFRDKSYEHGEIIGSIGINAKTNICLFADTVVTTELFDWTAGTKIHVEYDMIKDHVDIFIGEKANYETFDIRCDNLDGSGYSIYVNGNQGTVSYPESQELEKKVDFLMFIALRALNGATIDFSDVTLSDTMEDDDTGENIATFTINGQIKISGEYGEDEVDDFTAFQDDIAEIFSSFSVSVESLNVQAVVTTKVADASEIISATLDIEDLGFDMDFTDGRSIDFGCGKISLSLSDKEGSTLISLELSNLAVGFSGSPLTSHLEVKLSSTVGLGLKAGENSVGLVTDFEMRSSGFVPFITIEPKAAVINGSFYNTKEIKGILIDYLDMLLSLVGPS